MGFEGRENVRSTLGFRERTHPLGATVRKGGKKMRYIDCVWLEAEGCALKAFRLLLFDIFYVFLSTCKKC